MELYTHIPVTYVFYGLFMPAVNLKPHKLQFKGGIRLCILICALSIPFGRSLQKGLDRVVQIYETLNINTRNWPHKQKQNNLNHLLRCHFEGIFAWDVAALYDFGGQSRSADDGCGYKISYETTTPQAYIYYYKSTKTTTQMQV